MKGMFNNFTYVLSVLFNTCFHGRILPNSELTLIVQAIRVFDEKIQQQKNQANLIDLIGQKFLKIRDCNVWKTL